MKKILVFGLVALFATISLNAFAQKANPEAKKNLEAYPAATETMNRYVIFLDKKANENNFKVEVIAGKIMEVDCNKATLIGKLEEKTLEGWGYTYLDFETKGVVATTKMLCPDAKKTKKFVSAQPIMLDYNSRLPIVVYAPKGYDVQYKIWTAGKTIEAK